MGPVLSNTTIPSFLKPSMMKFTTMSSVSPVVTNLRLLLLLGFIAFTHAAPECAGCHGARQDILFCTNEKFTDGSPVYLHKRAACSDTYLSEVRELHQKSWPTKASEHKRISACS